MQGHQVTGDVPDPQPAVRRCLQLPPEVPLHPVQHRDEAHPWKRRFSSAQSICSILYSRACGLTPSNTSTVSCRSCVFANVACSLSSSSPSSQASPTVPTNLYLHGGVSRGGVKLAKIISAVHSEDAGSSIDWSLVRIKAAEIVGRLVAQIPEFSG
ncbi:unnamed protein product [Urochloa humidicola]